MSISALEPFMARRCLVATLASPSLASANDTFAKQLADGISMSHAEWQATFGTPFPIIENCRIEFSAASGLQIQSRSAPAFAGDTFTPANNVYGPIYLNDLSCFAIAGTTVSVIIWYGGPQA
jgi:hypothetical protein